MSPRKLDDRWVALHRPNAGGGIENIWLAYSRDLLYWGEPHCVLEEGRGPAWDALRVGAGPPPIETDRGWLLVYHGVKMYGGERVYRLGAALLDRDAPHQVLARHPKSIFKPTAQYELSGHMPNVVSRGLTEREGQPGSRWPSPFRRAACSSEALRPCQTA